MISACPHLQCAFWPSAAMSSELDHLLPGTLSLRICDSKAALVQAVTASLRDAVLAALQQRGEASLVVTGGSTARAYYPQIAALDLPWQRVQITLSDERLVAADHADSNQRLVREQLLQGRAAAARFVPLVIESDSGSGSDSGQDAAGGLVGSIAEGTAQHLIAAATERLQTLARPFDLVLLGMGADSHLASLFPGAAGIEAALDPANPALCCTVVPPAGVEPALPRLSLTLAALLDSRRILIVATGLAKRDAFERAALGHWPLPSPVQALARHARQPVEFIWCR